MHARNLHTAYLIVSPPESHWGCISYMHDNTSDKSFFYNDMKQSIPANICNTTINFLKGRQHCAAAQRCSAALLYNVLMLSRVRIVNSLHSLLEDYAQLRNLNCTRQNYPPTRWTCPETSKMAQNFGKLANTPVNASLFASPCPLMQDLLHGHALPACSLTFSKLQAAVSSPFRFLRKLCLRYALHNIRMCLLYTLYISLITLEWATQKEHLASLYTHLSHQPGCTVKTRISFLTHASPI